MSEDYFPTDPASADAPPLATTEPEAPTETHGRLIEYETATIISPMIYPPQPRLVVNGQKPRPGMDVRLAPVTYIQQPEFWEIHVLGSPGVPAQPDGPPVATQLPAEPGFGVPEATQLPAESTAYSVDIDLATCTGTLGIEVVGANQTERLIVPSAAEPETE